MSHLTCSSINIKDLDILRKVVAVFGGLKWNEGATTFKSYSKGSRLDNEIKEQGGTCRHSISIDGATYAYEIGIIQRNDGEGYSLVFDPFDPVAAAKVGWACEKVSNAYAEAVIRDECERNGFMLEESVDAEGCKILTAIVPD